ncbi:EpsG family protein, partial [Rosenbergiella epipactidis]|uniref:EpsG family protein n=1 Tax=Rosenbergiella epipactidis TaxID=1544694 RepID=UPI001F4D8C0C
MNKNPFVIFFILFLCIFFFNPYYSSLFLTILLASAMPLIKNRRKYIVSEFFFISSFLFVATISVGTKPIFGDTTGNDKFVYYQYMLENHSKSLLDWLISYRGFDFISYFSMKLSSDIFGVNNSAFIFIFLIYVSALYLGFKVIAKKYAPVAITLFFSQYIFASFYSNTIRQGISFTFIVLALAFSYSKRKYLYTLLACLSHYSSIIYAPFLLFINRFNNFTFKLSVFLYSVSYFFGAYALPFLLTKLSSLGSFFLVRVNSYGGDNFGVDYKSRVIMSLFFIFIVELSNLMQPEDKRNEYYIKIVRNIFVVFVCCFFFTSTFEEISNRYSFAIVPIGLLFFSISLKSITDSKVKVLLLFIIMIASWVFNLYIIYHRTEILYFGDFTASLSDNLLDVISKLQ